MIREFFQALEAAFPPNPPGHGQPRLLAGPKDAPGTVSLELFLPDSVHAFTFKEEEAATPEAREAFVAWLVEYLQGVSA